MKFHLKLQHGDVLEIVLKFSGVFSNVAHPKKAQKIEQKYSPSSLKLINSSKVRLLLLTYVSTVLLENIFILFGKFKRVHSAPQKKLENRAKTTFHQNCSGNTRSCLHFDPARCATSICSRNSNSNKKTPK